MYYWEKLFTSRANHFHVVLQTKLFLFMLAAVSVIKSLAVLIGALKIMNRQDHGTDSYRIERYSHINMFLWNVIGFDLMPKWNWIVEICMRFVTICRTNMIWCQSRSAEYWNHQYHWFCGTFALTAIAMEQFISLLWSLALNLRRNHYQDTHHDQT